jgi:hypothetical protein
MGDDLRPVTIRVTESGLTCKKPNKAAVAQLVEQRIRNAWVGGSNPFRGTIKNKHLWP